MFTIRQLLGAGATVGLITSGVSAQAAQQQQQQQPQARIITISHFKVPLGPDRQKVMDYMRKWMVEPARMNPNVVSYRVIAHWYGADAGDMAILAEYNDWASITAPCEPCQAWMRDNVPKEGTPERKAFDEANGLFMKYYGDHADEVYASPMNLAKVPKD